MGEYAKLNGQSVKIGTCEDMYYLRADQAHRMTPERGNIDPVKQAESIRFRFPFPQEDGIEPGAFQDPFYTLGVSGVEVPECVDHSFLQFTRNYPKAGGMTVSTPCPNSKEGKASGLRFNRNGYSGDVQIAQQRLVNGQLVLVCQCGGCGAAYRMPTIEDAQPVIDALLKDADDTEAYHARNRRADDTDSVDGRVAYLREIARRIVAGTCEQMKYEVTEYMDGKPRATVAGMGRNRGTLDTTANTLATARRWARICRKRNPGFQYKANPQF